MAENFKLQTVLDYRQRLENLAQQGLADALRREAALQQQIAEAQNELHRLQQDLTSRQQDGITVHDLQLFALSIKRQRKALQDLMKQALRLHRDVTVQRDRLTRAAQDKKLLESLKEKKEAEQRYLEQRLETAELDDLAMRLGKNTP